MILTDAKLKTIALAALVLLALTIVVYAIPRHQAPAVQSGALLIQGLDPAIITRVALRQGEKKTTISQNAGGVYAVEEKHGYPADLQDLNSLLVDILDIRIAAQPKTATPDDCGLDPKKPEGGEITLAGKDGKELLSLLVGKTTEKGTFFSRAGTIYLSEKPFSFTCDPMNFVDQTLYSVSANDAVRIDADLGGKKYAFEKDKSGTLHLAGVPAGKVENTDETWGLKDGLGRVSFEDVLPAAGVEFKPELTAEITLETTMKYRLAVGKGKDGKYLAQAQAVAPNDKKLQESMQLRANTAKKELAEKDAVLTANDKAKEFNARSSGWLYQLSDWSAKRLLTDPDKLLKDAPKEEPKAEAKPAAPAAETPAATTPAAPAAPVAPAAQ